MRTVNEITEKTLVPISIVIMLLGGAAFVTKAYGELEDLKDERETYQKQLLKIDERLSRIEGKLGQIADE